MDDSLQNETAGEGASSAPKAQSALRCLGGASAPQDLRDDLMSLRRLSDSARAHFWQALGPSLVDPVPPELERRLDVFCAEHHAEPSDLAHAIKASRMLVRGAARHGVDQRGFLADLETLGVEGPIVVLLAAGFERAVGGLRRDAARRAIGGHGAVLTAVDWRVDRVMDTKEARGLGIDVAVVTLRYRDATGDKTLTLHALPDMLDELRRIGVVG
jgi:hypothetical protein